MFFRIKSTSTNADIQLYRTKYKAKLKLALYIIGPTEILLSRYLQEHFNKTLKTACLEILQNVKSHINQADEIIITIPDKQLNDIAKIITYGTGKICGSTILKDILTIT